MCNFVPVRNWLIAAVVLVTFAISSGWLAYGFMSAYPIVAMICFYCASTWAFLAVGDLVFALLGIGRFCSCTSSVTRCKAPCDALLSGGLTAALIALATYGVVCGAAGGGQWSQGLVLVALFLATGAMAALTIYIGYQVAQLSSCQPTG